MARTTARTNGRSRPNGSQHPFRSQATQARRGRRRDEEDEDQEEGAAEAEEQDEDEEEEEEDENDGAVDDTTRKANALVRLALFNESRHMPLRREEINKRVLGNDTRAFKNIFSLAQRSLQSTFGMELVELMSRAERDREQNANDEIQEDANATGLKKKATATGSKSYILRSTLPDELIRIASETNEELFDVETRREGDDDDDDDDDVPSTYGSIISWTSADQPGGLGLIYVILSLILVNGHSMSDLELKKHLRTFHLPVSGIIEFVPHATRLSMPIESYLASLVKQGHLDKLKLSSNGAPRPTQGKRIRGAEADEEGATYEWRWGARAQAEVGERAIAEFIAEFMAERVIRETENAADEDSAQRMAEEEREKVRGAFMKDITRSAGGRLNDVR